MKKTLINLTALLFLASCSDEADAGTNEVVLKFSSIPDHGAKLLRAKYSKFAEHLSGELGVKVEYVPSADYQATVAMFVNQEIGFGWFGGVTGVQAREKVKGANAVAMGKKDKEFVSYFIVPKGSPIQPGPTFPMAAKGKRFTFGAKQSTSGRVMPEFFIRLATGQAPEEFFTEVNFSPKHDQTIALVKNGSFDIGVVNFITYDKMVADGSLKREDCPIVWITPNYQDYQFTVRPDLDEEFGSGFTARLTKTLLAMDAEMADAFAREKMIPAKNEDFQDILEIVKTVGLLR